MHTSLFVSRTERIQCNPKNDANHNQKDVSNTMAQKPMFVTASFADLEIHMLAHMAKENSEKGKMNYDRKKLSRSVSLTGRKVAANTIPTRK